MENFTRIPKIKEFIYSTLPDVSSSLFKSLISPSFTTDGLNGVVIFSSSKLISVISAKKFLSICTNTEINDLKKRELEVDISGKNGKVTVVYKQFSNIIEIDIDLFLPFSNEKNILIEFLKNILDQKCILAPRHIIYIIGIEKLQGSIITALHNIIEKSYENAFFVMSCSKITSAMNVILLPNLLFVKNNVDNKKILFSFFEEEIKKECTNEEKNEICLNNIKKKIDIVLKKANYDIINTIFLWDIPQIELFKGHLTSYIETFIDNIMYEKCQIIETETKIRSFCTNIGAACIPLAEVATRIIQFVKIKYPHYIYDVVSMSAKMEHISVISNKELFVLEKYIKQVIFLLRYNTFHV